MGGTALHAGILAQWFEMLLMLPFLKSASMMVSGILIGVMQPLQIVKAKRKGT